MKNRGVTGIIRKEYKLRKKGEAELEKVDYIQWHPAFAGGIELALRDYKKDLTFEREHNLSKKPLQIDLLVIKKNPDVIVDTNIGRIFRTYNIVEYKSPKDGLNIDDFYKVVAYACLYKSLASHVDEIPIEKISISLFRDKCPVKLFEKLRRSGLEVNEEYKGVYYVCGFPGLSAQIVVIRELDDRDSLGLRVLTDKPREEDLLAFADWSKSMTDKDDCENADAVLQVSVSANRSVYDELNRRYPKMCEALMELMKPEFDRRLDIEVKKQVDIKVKEQVEQATEKAAKKAAQKAAQKAEKTALQNIKSIMENFQVSAQRAMEVLKIPVSEQPKYIARL